ncbi:MAG: metal-dependent hydrolase [Halobacteriota archaeon]
MYRKGHLGVSLLVYSPIGYALVSIGEPVVAILTAVVMVSLAMLPDIDHQLPLVDHRGPTHSLLFAVLVGGLFAVAGGLFEGHFTVWSLNPAAFGFLLGFVAVFAHLLGDTLTPSGVNYLWPISSTRFSLSITRADSQVANYGLFALGVITATTILGRSIGLV